MAGVMNDYSWWKEASKAGAKPDQEDLYCGRFRRRTKDGFRPVAIWVDEDGAWNVLDGRYHTTDADWIETFKLRAWPFCEAVSDEDYQAVVAGGDWSDMAPATPLHNKPPEDVAVQIDSLMMDAHRMVQAGPATTQAVATRAANLKGRLADLSKQVTSNLLEACAPLDNEIARLKTQVKLLSADRNDVASPFMAMNETIETSIDRLTKIVIGPWLIAERKRQQAAEAAGEAEPQKNRRGETMKTPTNVGAVGSKTKLVTRWRAEVEDWPKALMALVDHPELRTEVQRIANAAARSKARLPIAGVKFISEDIPQ